MTQRTGSRHLAVSRFLLAFVLILLALIQPAAPRTVDALPMDPALRSLISGAEGHTSVAVIVQKATGGTALEEVVARLGGEVTRDLHIINAFAAELPAEAVPELAAAPGVRWVSLDAPVTKSICTECIDTSKLDSAYVRSIGADRLWNEAPYLQGQSVTVAVVDGGVNPHADLLGLNTGLRVVASVSFRPLTFNTRDQYGHGTYIAGIIGGNGVLSMRTFMGVAPKVRLVNLKVTDDEGRGTTSDVVEGLQWAYEHKSEYNIRVVNLSLNSSVPESYHTSPLDAAVEILWFNGVVVVVSAGNNGAGLDNGILYPPANDPFVITVGAADDHGTADTADDTLAPFSAFGTTDDGFAKPDIVAPGTNIVSLLASKWCTVYREHPENRVTSPLWGLDRYFRMSGTSAASAVTAGAVALLLQDEPDLNPDQVKYRLMATARPFGTGAGAGYLDVYAAVRETTAETANTGTPASHLLSTGDDAANWASVNWGSVNWGSVNWGSVNWGSVNWGSVNWGSVNWGSDYWGQ